MFVRLLKLVLFQFLYSFFLHLLPMYVNKLYGHWVILQEIPPIIVIKYYKPKPWIHYLYN